MPKRLLELAMEASILPLLVIPPALAIFGIVMDILIRKSKGALVCTILSSLTLLAVIAIWVLGSVLMALGA